MVKPRHQATAAYAIILALLLALRALWREQEPSPAAAPMRDSRRARGKSSKFTSGAERPSEVLNY